MLTRLSTEESYALLRGCRLARLGCIVNDEPYVVPVNYVFDGESFLIHSLPGRKIEAMRARPRVCLQADEIKDHLAWKSVVAYGSYEEINDDAERERAMNCVLSFFPQLTPVESLIATDAAAPAPVVFRVRVEQVTGIMEG